jgi:hypothetical protein
MIINYVLLASTRARNAIEMMNAMLASQGTIWLIRYAWVN